MKILFKVITAIFALGVVILVGLHLFLQYGLTKAMREVVLPQVHKETGIDARVGGLSINVPNGILYLKEVAVRNPEGFLLENLASVDRIQVEVDIMSLLKQQLILVKNIEVKNALVNVIRNKDGEINVNKLQEQLPQPVEPIPGDIPRSGEGTPYPEPMPSEQPSDKPTSPEPGLPEPAIPSEPVEEPKVKPLPEVLIEALQCQTTVRYVDFRLDQLDIALDLNVIGINLSTRKDPAAEWGDVSVIGSLGNNRASFITDLKLRLAPLLDAQNPSFDLTGKVLEIDPRIMDELYEEIGIRTAPFGIDPQLKCRSGRFKDSAVTLNMSRIEFEDKVSKKLGGMGTIESLRFAVPVEGTLQNPKTDVTKALYGAIGSNAGTLLDSWIKGAARKEAGLESEPETLGDAAVAVLGKHVDEIGESETARKVLKDLAGGETSDTNAPPPATTDVIVDILGEQVKEIGESEEIKEDLKNLGKWLFGK